MIKMWAKVLNAEHIEKQFVFESDKKFTYAQFFEYVSEICDRLDVPTPIILKPHIFNYAKFRHVIFRPSDFMEEVPFDKLVIENIL